MPIPDDSLLQVSALARLFRNTTNSYKYLFFLALLDCLEGRFAADVEERIPLRSLALGMLQNAYYPHVRFRLSFGSQDQVASMLDRHPLAVFSFDRAGSMALRAHLDSAFSDLSPLTRYVPRRLIRVFFEAETRGIQDSRVDLALEGLSREHFHTRRPLYRLEDDAIEVHPEWVRYLRTHLGILRGWVAWEWVRYMQSRNPNVPALPCKLFPPNLRASLQKQTDFWRAVLSVSEYRCLYTGEIVSPEAFSLDHFVPWSFVAHDQLWNLLPVLPRVNSSKSDSLPPLALVEELPRVHAEALVHARSFHSESAWARVTECYVADLKVPPAVLMEPSREPLRTALAAGYANTVPALLQLARGMGFSDWSVGPPG